MPRDQAEEKVPVRNGLQTDRPIFSGLFLQNAIFQRKFTLRNNSRMVSKTKGALCYGQPLQANDLKGTDSQPLGTITRIKVL